MTHVLDTDTAFNALFPICKRCTTFTSLLTVEAGDGKLYATIQTERTSFDVLSGRFYKAGYNVIQVDCLGRDTYLLTMVIA